jgi:hypothetical protein
MGMIQNGATLGTYGRTNLSGATVSNNASWTGVGSISIPHTGLWDIQMNHRYHYANAGNFVKANIGTASDGTGNLGDARWLQETLGGGNTDSMSFQVNWILNMGTDQSYAKTIYLFIMAYNRTQATSYTTSDSNGVPHCTFHCFGGTQSTGITEVVDGSAG